MIDKTKNYTNLKVQLVILHLGPLGFKLIIYVLKVSI
jgi:hypothetical protein